MHACDPTRYATAQQKMSRAAHPKETATLIQLLCAAGSATAPAGSLQLVAASATVGRPLRRQLASLSGRPSFEVVQPSEADAPPRGVLADAAGDAASPDAAAGGRAGGRAGGAARAVGLPANLAVRVVTSEADNVLTALHAELAALPHAQAIVFVPWGRGVRTELRLLRQCGLPLAAPLADALGAGNLTAPRADTAAAAAAETGAEAEQGARVLVAAPSAARGLDVHGVDLVVVMGVPPSADHFLHLAGRTARYGAPGTVLLLATPEERASRLPALGSQLGLDLAADVRHSHTAERNEEWASQWAVHQKIVDGSGATA